LSTLLYFGLRRVELCALTVGDLQRRRGVMDLRIHMARAENCGMCHSGTAEAIDAYLALVDRNRWPVSARNYGVS